MSKYSACVIFHWLVAHLPGTTQRNLSLLPAATPTEMKAGEGVTTDSIEIQSLGNTWKSYIPNILKNKRETDKFLDIDYSSRVNQEGIANSACALQSMRFAALL